MKKLTVTLPVCKMDRESDEWVVREMTFPVNRIKRIENCKGRWGIDCNAPESEIYLDNGITYLLRCDITTAEQKINE